MVAPMEARLVWPPANLTKDFVVRTEIENIDHPGVPFGPFMSHAVQIRLSGQASSGMGGPGWRVFRSLVRLTR